MRWIGFLVAVACAGKDVRPILEQLPFEIAPLDDVTQRAGDLDFLQEVSQDKVLLEFAGRLIDGGTGPEGVILPHLTARLDATVNIRAAGAGFVDAVEVNTDSSVPDDFEIRILPEKGSRWVVGYDHVAAPTVAVGDRISAGTILGTGIPEKKFELDVMDGSTDVRWCQNTFFPDPIRAALEDRILTLFAEWETYKGDPAIYDEAAMFAPGCAVESYEEAE